MFVHLVQDEKFIGSAMRLFEAAAPGQNCWVILGSPVKLQHLAPSTVIFMEPEDFISKWSKGTVVFIHMMHTVTRRVLFATQCVRFVWIAWGADFYVELLGDSLYGTKSRALAPRRRQLGWRKKIKRSTFKLLPPTLLRTLAQRFPDSFIARGAEAPVETMIRQCHAIIFVVPCEADIVRNHFPRLRFNALRWNYFAFEGRAEIPDLPPHSDEQAVLIGNSASVSSNHLECLDLVRTVGRALDVYLPLSYGDNSYRASLVRALPEMAPHNVIVLDEFLSLRQYQFIVSKCCYVIMGHRRQQGMGNIIYALAAGARVYLDATNPVYKHFQCAGAIVFTLEEFPAHANAGLGWLDAASTTRNREIIRRLYGWTASVERTKALIRALTPPVGKPTPLRLGSIQPSEYI